MEEGLSFAGWLRERRVLAGLTQAQLAERAGVSLRAVRNAELGSVRRPRPETERRLREALAEAPPEPVRIGVLGPLVVRCGDSPVEIGAEKQRLLLAMLALQPNRTVRREDLVDVIWDEPPPSCLELLHTYVARLRRALRPADLITTDKGGYRLSAGEDELDLLSSKRCWPAPTGSRRPTARRWTCGAARRSPTSNRSASTRPGWRWG